MRAAGVPMEAVPKNLTTAYVHERVIPAALSLLPAKMDTAKARVLLVAIGLQESRFVHRRQIGGPATGFWMFEQGGGLRGVLEHPASKPYADAALAALRYRPEECWDALPHNDVLACVLARLLLWTHTKPLPASAATAWRYYLDTWRPGKPHPETWEDFYQLAWKMEET